MYTHPNHEYLIAAAMICTLAAFMAPGVSVFTGLNIIVSLGVSLGPSFIVVVTILAIGMWWRGDK